MVTARIIDLTLAEIKSLNADGEKIPTFTEVIEFAKMAHIPIMPEAKSPHLYPGLEAKMIEEITAAGYGDRTLIQSFDAYTLR